MAFVPKSKKRKIEIEKQREQDRKDLKECGVLAPGNEREKLRVEKNSKECKESLHVQRKEREVDIAVAMELRFRNGYTYQKIGDYFNTTGKSIQKLLDKYKNLLFGKEELESYRKMKVDILENAEFQLLQDLMKKGRRDNASLTAITTALNTLNNMGRLEKGLSTENVAFLDMSDSLEKLQKERKRLEEDLMSGKI